MEEVDQLRLQLEEERRATTEAALRGRDLLERCERLQQENEQLTAKMERYEQLEREREQLERENEQLRQETQRRQRERPEEDTGSHSSWASLGRGSPRGREGSRDSPTSRSWRSLRRDRTSSASERGAAALRHDSRGPPTVRQHSIVSQLRQSHFVQLEHAQELRRDLDKKKELVCALEDEKRVLIEQLAEQRREESTLVKKFEKEKGGLKDQLEDLTTQVSVMEKQIISMGHQLELAKERQESKESNGSRNNWRSPQMLQIFSEASSLNHKSRRRHSDRYDRSDPRGDSVDDELELGNENRQLLETLAEELQKISGSQQSLASNTDAKIKNVQDLLESLSVTLTKPSLHTQTTMDALQMEDNGEILSTLHELQSQLVTVHESVGSLAARPDSGAASGEVEGMIARSLQGFQDQLRAKLEALQEQQDASARQLREKIEAFHEQHEALGGLIAQRALDGLGTAQREADRGEAARLHQEGVRLCEQLAAQLEGARAGCERELARAVQGLQLERASLGDAIAQRALDRLGAERPGPSGGEAARLHAEVARLHEQLAAKQGELAKTAEGFQVERAGLLKLLGSALDGLTAERQEAGRGEMARLCGQLAAQLEGAKAGCQQELARALQGLQAERASEPQGVRQELELEAERLRAELASAEQRVKDGLQDRQRLSRAVEGARRDMAGLQAELERLRAAPEPSARELREEVAQLRRQLAAEKEAQKRIQRQADTDVVRSLVALRDLDANFFSPAR